MHPSSDSSPSLPPLTLAWNDEALALLQAIPSFVRKRAAERIETFAMGVGYHEVTPTVMEESKQAEIAQPAAAEASGTTHHEEEAPRQFVSFSFYKLDPSWRRLPVSDRTAHKAEFAKTYDTYAQGGQVICRSYSTVGIRSDCDLMLWKISYQLDTLQTMSADLLRTPLGGWLSPGPHLLGMTKRSSYVDKVHPGHDASRLKVVPGRARYLFVYPFVKTREWYLMRPHARQGIMDEHIEVGTAYSRVKINTTYSFGIDDQDFVVAFESNYPQDFVDLVQALRETESSRFTARDTPLYTCIARPLTEALDLLG